MSLLHRQVPSHLRKMKREAWIAFQPSERDEGWLSVSCGEICSAAVAFERYVARKNPKGRNLESDGVLSVSRTECAGLSLPVKADPLDDDDAHHLIGFNHLDEPGVLQAAIELHAFARARDWQHRPSAAAPQNTGT